MKPKAKCPHCGTSVYIDKVNSWRPFCSERCKLIDLGDWVNGSHRIAGSEINPDYAQGPDNEPETHH